MEHIALVERVIKQLSLGDVDVAHALKTTLCLNPLENFSAYVNRIARRGVIHAATVDMRFVLQHRGNAGQIISGDKVVANNSNRDTRRTHVLLSATINEAVLGHIDRLAQKARRNIRYQRHVARFGQRVVFGAIDGLVFADVHVIGVRIHLQLGHIGHIAEIIIGRITQNTGIAKALRFLVGLFAPRAAHDILGKTAAHKVQGHHGELRRTAALQEQHLIVIRDTHEVAQIGFSLFDNRLES